MNGTTSPFVTAMAHDEWVLWESAAHVAELQEQKPTDGRSVLRDVADEMPVQSAYIPPIQRMQYNAVLSRMNQATRKTGEFSAWA